MNTIPNSSSSPSDLAADHSQTSPSLEEVRQRFQGDRFATENGAVIDAIGEGYAKCSMELSGSHRNAAGAVMGGAIFTLADFAFAVAANWNRPLHVSLTSQITYLATAKGSRLTAEARCVKDGRSTCYYEIQVHDDLGRLIAHVTTNGFSVGH